MAEEKLAGIVQALAVDYPAADVEATERALRRVLDVALATLIPKARAARQAGQGSVLEV